MKNKVDKLYGKKIRKVQDLIKLKTDFEMVTPINKSGFGTIRFEDIRLKKNIHICAIFDKKLNITFYDKNVSFISDDSDTNLFVIKKNEDCYGVVDALGNLILPCVYKDITLDTEGDEEPDENTPIHVITKDKQHMLFNRKGQILGEPHQYIESICINNMFKFRDEDCCGTLDRNGQVTREFPYCRLKLVFEDEKVKYFIVENKNLSQGLIDLNGKVLIEIKKYRRVNYLGNDKFLVVDLKESSKIVNFHKLFKS